MVDLQRTLCFDEDILPCLLKEREIYSGQKAEKENGIVIVISHAVAVYSSDSCVFYIEVNQKLKRGFQSLMSFWLNLITIIYIYIYIKFKILQRGVPTTTRHIFDKIQRINKLKIEKKTKTTKTKTKTK